MMRTGHPTGFLVNRRQDVVIGVVKSEGPMKTFVPIRSSPVARAAGRRNKSGCSEYHSRHLQQFSENGASRVEAAWLFAHPNNVNFDIGSDVVLSFVRVV